MSAVAEQFHFDPATYLDMVRSEVPDYDELQDTVAAAAAEVDARAVLDLGSGTGETLHRVATRLPRATLVGIDESDGMLAVARARVPAADLRIARLQDALPPGPFDVVVSALAVHHLDAEEKAGLFRRVARCLRPGGRFVLGDVVVPDDPADAITPLDEGYDQPSTVDDQVRWLTDAALRPAVRWRRRDLAVMVADAPR